MGRINDRQYLAKLMASSDVFVLPSRREGMPLAPMEAMSAGVPIIIARLPGSTDQANVHGVTGFYVPPDDASELQCAMQTLGENRQLREAMGQKARERIVETFGWQQHIDRWERLYCNAK
jgi:glycosyltransferase involved in cell wall biosynthesis